MLRDLGQAALMRRARHKVRLSRQFRSCQSSKQHCETVGDVLYANRRNLSGSKGSSGTGVTAAERGVRNDEGVRDVGVREVGVDGFVRINNIRGGSCATCKRIFQDRIARSERM